MEVETQDYLQAELSRRLPARRIDRPAELDAMSMSMYLCGPAVSWATHQIITVDGAV
jgi:NAD(P)-dependent dehydrogenase (short-subunit alcohol dehydrogenase family)